MCGISPVVEFISAAKKAVSTSCPLLLHLVLGNEACDLDSAVSAIVYSFLLHSLPKEDGQKKVSVAPVLNIPAEDYPLKTEVTHWLAKHGILQHSLIFRDEVDLSQLAKAGKLKLTLVDHHVLPPHDAHLESTVVSILDHRPLEARHPACQEGGLVVEPVGSCCTLVAEQVLSKNPALLDATTASLLYGTVILDTVNLNPAAKRVTPKDVQMCEELERRLKPQPTSSLEVFQELTEAKANVGDLSCDQLLRKDVKVATGDDLTLGVASVPLRVTDFLARCEGGAGVTEHRARRGYQVLVVLGVTITQQDVTRDLAVFCPDDSLRAQVVAALRDGDGGVLQLVPLETGGVKECQAFHQGNAGASRKVVLPILKAWLATRNQ